MNKNSFGFFRGSFFCGCFYWGLRMEVETHAGMTAARVAIFSLSTGNLYEAGSNQKAGGIFSGSQFLMENGAKRVHRCIFCMFY
jgi:hypothetical protein